MPVSNGGSVVAGQTIATGNPTRAMQVDDNGVVQVAGTVVSGGATTPADAQANPTTASLAEAFMMAFNGTTWDRVRSAGDSADGIAVGGTGILKASSRGFGFNGTTWDRLRSAGSAATSTSTGDTGISAVAPLISDGTNFRHTRSAGSGVADGGAGTTTPSAGLILFNNSTWDRQRSASGGNNTATTSTGVAQVSVLSTWSSMHAPAVGTLATISKAAGGGTVRHVATGLVWSFANDGTVNTTARSNTVRLRDGATGAGTVLAEWHVFIPVTSDSAAQRHIHLTGLNISGSANTAMTLEFEGTAADHTFYNVTLLGYSTP